MTVEYDGTRYRGWQVQRNARTVAGELSSALRAVLRESPRVFAAGRTDAGVHANGQVVSFFTRSSLTPRQLREQVNDRLPQDICVLSVTDAPTDFHARHSALARTYRYQISTRRTAFGKKYVWWIRSALDRQVLTDIAGEIGRSTDFRSYADLEETIIDGAPREGSARVKVRESFWQEDGELLVYKITADRFLWKMVRRLVGTMASAALGRIDKEAPARWLRERSGEPAKHTAPPSGLFLESVLYKPHPATGRDAGRSRRERRGPERK